MGRKKKSTKSLLAMADRQINKLKENSVEISVLLEELIKRKQEDIDNKSLQAINAEMEKVDDLIERVLRNFD